MEVLMAYILATHVSDRQNEREYTQRTMAPRG